MLSSKVRFWQHDDGWWRIQDHHQLTTRDGMQDVWESRRDEHGRVLFFKTEDQARAYLESGEKKQNEQV